MKKFIVSILMLIMTFPDLSFSQALPASPMQKAVSGVIQQKMASRGFASNDPRWAGTLSSIGVNVVSSVAAAGVVTLAGITAPAWVTLAATIALGTLFAAGINLALDGTINWINNSDGTVATSSGSGVHTQPANGDKVFWGSTYNGLAVQGTDIDTVGTAIIMYAESCGTFTLCSIPNLTWHANATTVSAGTLNPTIYTVSGYWTSSVITNTTWPRSATVKGAMAFPAGPAPSYIAPPPVATPTVKTPSQAVAALTPEELAKPLNPDVVAKIAESVWEKAAAQPGYTGFPVDAANKITAADATAYRTVNASSWPTVGDAVKPQPAPAGGAQADAFMLPNSAAAPAIDPGTSTPPITSPTFDWGIPSTSESIPKQSVPVTYTPTIFAAPTGCPAPIAFSMYGKQYAIAWQPACDLMSTLAPIFLACGAAAAALIFAQSLKS